MFLSAAISAWIVGLLAGSQWPRADRTDERFARPAYQFPEPKLDLPGLDPQYRAFLEEAYQVALRLVDAFPESPDSVAAMALLHYMAHDPAGETECWQRCLELDPGFRQAHERMGTLAMEAGEYERAADLMRRAVAVAPYFPEAHNMLATALTHLGQVEEAVGVLQNHLQINPTSATGHFLLGQSYLQLKEDEKAKKEFETAIQLNPEYPSPYQGLMTACARLGEEEKAAEYRETFESVKQRDAEARKRSDLAQYKDEVFVPQRIAEIITVAGTLYLAHGDLDQAEQHLLRAVEVDPTYTDGLKALCTLYDQQGRLEDALRVTGQLSELEPFNPIHHRNVGILCARLNRLDEAEGAFRTVCVLAPREAVGYVALAELYLRARRNLAEAKALALTGVQREPAPRNYLVLAAVCESSGDLAGARSALAQAAALDPGNPRYQQMLDSIGEQK